MHQEATQAEYYKIYRDGELIGHATENVFIDYEANDQNSYHYTVTGKTAFVESNPSNIVYVDWTTDIQETANDTNIQLYPNPTNGQVTIKADGLRQIRVFNVMGQEVKCLTTPEDNVTIDLSSQPKGCYFIETTTEQGCSTRKIVRL